MKNLEIKVQVNSLDLIKNRLLFSEEGGVLIQKDIYYLLGDTKLKLREEGSEAELILYTRPKVKGSRESKYFRFYLSNFLKRTTKRFFYFLFGEKIIVNKERLLFLYKHTRIHLDKVIGLGEFIELETVFNGDIPDSSFVKEHDEVKKLLRLEEFPIISGSYSDLLLNITKTKK